MRRNVEVRWKRGTAAGYTDVFPVDEFAKTLTHAERAHLVRGPRGGQHSARFSLTVKTSNAEMDYTAFPVYNKRHGMEHGVMRFRFADANGARCHSPRRVCPFVTPINLVLHHPVQFLDQAIDASAPELRREFHRVVERDVADVFRQVGCAWH